VSAEADALPLAEVLRRCHRHELQALAAAVAIKPVLTMGRDKLASSIETALRRAGSNDIVNLVKRRGPAPVYEAVLLDLAKRRGVRAPEVAEAERTLAKQAVANTALDKPRPPLVRAGLTAAMFALRLLMPLFGPAAGIGFLFWLGRKRDDVLLPAVVEVARLRDLVAHRVTVGVVGTPSSGKDAAIRTLFGVDTGNVSPVAGATRSVAVYPVAGGEGLEVVNTPGLGDVEASLTDETRSVLGQVDLFLFLVNAQGGVRAREQGEWERVKARGKPALVVVNKLDTLRPDDRERMVADVASKLAVDPSVVVGAAVDPLPQLMPTPMGVYAIREWVHDQLTALGRGRLPTA